MQKRKHLGELRPLAPLLGKTIEEARAWVAENKPASPKHSWITLDRVRVVRADGQGCNVHCDSRMERVNVETEAGVVVRIVDLG